VLVLKTFYPCYTIRLRFAPELLNRLSAIVMLQPLIRINLYTTNVSSRLVALGVTAVLESAGAQAILAASYGPLYGAWPVERDMESIVVTTSSKIILCGELNSDSLVPIRPNSNEREHEAVDNSSADIAFYVLCGSDASKLIG
jgi:ATP-dependent Clp protease ATP-binding subunit ClpA